MYLLVALCIGYEIWRRLFMPAAFSDCPICCKSFQDCPHTTSYVREVMAKVEVIENAINIDQDVQRVLARRRKQAEK